MRIGYINPTDRVAAACIEAARPWCSKRTGSELEMLQGLANPRERHNQLVRMLVRQLGRQGLSPEDLDNPNGTAAIQAVADALFNGPRKLALLASLPNEWKLVANAAARIIDFQSTKPR